MIKSHGVIHINFIWVPLFFPRFNAIRFELSFLFLYDKNYYDCKSVGMLVCVCVCAFGYYYLLIYMDSITLLLMSVIFRNETLITKITIRNAIKSHLRVIFFSISSVKVA